MEIAKEEILSAIVDKYVNATAQGASDDSHWQVGENYIIRTVTHINTGKLIKVTDKELVLQDAAWVADTGRFEQCVKYGELSEVEPFPDGEPVIVGRGALIDAVRWLHPLPREQK